MSRKEGQLQQARHKGAIAPSKNDYMGLQHRLPVLSLFCCVCDLSIKLTYHRSVSYGFEQNCFIQIMRQTVTVFVDYLQTAVKTED